MMAPAMKVGVLDLGSNSFQLLAAEATGPNDVLERNSKRIGVRIGTRLGEPDDNDEEARQQALDTVGNLIHFARTVDKKMPIITVGKTELHNSEQGTQFLKTVQRRYGITVELLTGEDAAKLTYRGVRSRLTEIRERLGVINISGSSTSIGVGQRRFCFFGESAPIGFLRTQGFDAVTLRKCIDTHCFSIARTVASLGPERWLLSGGTSRALGRVALALARMHHGQLEREDIVSLSQYVRNCPVSELTALGVPMNRAALFPQATALLAELVEYFAIPSIGISSGGLQHGLVLREYERACFAGLTTTNPRANRDGQY
jgi:exopolyphosphatase/guanosine-5'-triphosphate,3'-diphosphate pyrophosphatase